MSEDVKFNIVTTGGALVSLEEIKNIYICEGITPQDLADRFKLPVESIEKLVSDNKLDELRAAHIKHGLSQLKSVQLKQAEKIIDLESKFKRMRIVQLEKMLEDYMAYFSVHGHFYKMHPITDEILRDTNGIPIQIKLPNISKEIMDLKETFTLSEGLNQMLSRLDDIIKQPSKKNEEDLDPNVIDVTEMNGLFRPRSETED